VANGLIMNNSLTVIGGSQKPGATQFSAPAAPGQPPTQTIVSAGQRNIAAVAALDTNRFARITTRFARTSPRPPAMIHGRRSKSWT
jgi:hypothetical protein